MYKRPLLFIGYTLVIILPLLFDRILFSTLRHATGGGGKPEFYLPEKIEQSPLQDDNTIVEVFSYACHYCEVNESGVAELEKRLPAGAKLVRLHLSDDSQAGMAAFAPLFATLTIMGIEAQHRPAAYRAIIKENLNLADDKQLSAWLTANGSDEGCLSAGQRVRAGQGAVGAYDGGEPLLPDQRDPQFYRQSQMAGAARSRVFRFQPAAAVAVAAR